MNETRFAQTTFISDPFSVTHKMLRPERGHFKNNPNIKIRLLNFADPFSAQMQRIWLPLFLTWLLFLTSNRPEPRRLCGTENGSETGVFEPKASFACFPFFVPHNRVPRRGEACGRLLSAYSFLAKQERVSGCRATPGLFPR
ncbi:hypothetical protein [Undibacterium terreum]|uniref:hypothetical protein n=1 Tax=Undibacterium terreum TaxID=1224302 RepID=UPI001662A082|nr:hypothetical protein [Undibacterium terreum]